MHPKAFISYSWDSDPHKKWVADLAARLRADGIDTQLDQWQTVPGDQLPHFMERGIRENDFVIIIRQITFNPSAQQVAGAGLNLKTYPGLTITGVVGRTYRVESSSNMSNWTAEATLVLNSSPYLWFDQNAVNGKRFYRAFLLP